MDAQANERADRVATSRGMKRRGILAAAAAVLAGIVAKQTAQPVAAVFNLQAETSNNVAAPTTLTATSGFTPTATGVLRVDASGAGAAGVDGIQGTGKGAFSGMAGFGGSSGGNGVFGQGGGTGASAGAGVAGVAAGATNPGGSLGVGVYGTGRGAGKIGMLADSDSGIGLKAISDTSIAVVANGGNVGVLASGGPYGVSASGTTYGVVGNGHPASGSGGAGVYGTITNLTDGNYGVLGDGGNPASGSVGVQGQHAQYGVVGKVSNAANSIGVWGNNTSTGAGAIGVRGDCTNGIGVYGSTSAAGQYGVIGQTLVDNAFGLAGIANTNGSAAFAGGTTNASSYAASFQGHVQVFDGAFDVFPMGNKHGLAQHPDGSVRTFYSVESPECWVEDFGEGTLANGAAEVALEKDFAALIHTDTYHVFLTAHSDQHLHVAQRHDGGFSVVADVALAALKGKKVSDLVGTFSWRVVAKPKTEAKVERLAKATLAPKIDMSKLPKPSSPPVAATPKRP